MTMTTQASRTELDLLCQDLWRSTSSTVEAQIAMPQMTVDWFGPASEAWQRRAEELRARITALQHGAHRAATIAQRITA